MLLVIFLWLFLVVVHIVRNLRCLGGLRVVGAFQLTVGSMRLYGGQDAGAGRGQGLRFAGDRIVQKATHHDTSVELEFSVCKAVSQVLQEFAQSLRALIVL